MTFNNILVAVDGGPQMDQVLAAAAGVTRTREGAHIHVLFVEDVLPLVSSGMVQVSDLALEAMAGQAESVVSAAVEHLDHLGVLAEGHVVGGEPSQAIAEAAEKWGCGMIVLGHRHVTLWRRVFDPSTCLDVLERAPCPVLVVTDKATNHASILDSLNP